MSHGRDYKRTPEWRRLADELGAAARRAAEVWWRGSIPGEPVAWATGRSELARFVGRT